MHTMTVFTVNSNGSSGIYNKKCTIFSLSTFSERWGEITSVFQDPIMFCNPLGFFCPLFRV